MLALRRSLAVLGAFVAVLAVAGAVLAFVTFGPGSPASAPSASGGVPAIVRSSASSPDAPADFRDRPAFRSCGEVVLAQGEQIPATGIQCLTDPSSAGRELVVVSSTTEGDPIVRWFRTGPGITGVQVFEDATRDRFSGAWHESSCRSGQIDQLGACA